MEGLKLDDGAGTSQTPNDSNSTHNLHASESVNIRLPTFWHNSIATWFVQVEAQFTIGRIVSDQKKYNYVVASLPQDVAESLMDIFENPPEIDRYKNLKDTLIQRHSVSIEKRIQQLVTGEEIGDRKPSEFYRHMKMLAGTTATVGDVFIKKLWLSRLPNLISIALIPQSDGDMDLLLSTADKIWEAMPNSSSVSAIQESSFSKKSSSADDDRYTRLEREIHSLRDMISSMNFQDRNSRSRSRQGSETNTRKRSQSNRRKFDRHGSLCWYHFKFGDQATKCVQPCRRNLKPTSSNANSNSSN